MSYRATEYHTDDGEPTGRTETFQADSIHDAVAAVLYARQLKNAAAEVGPSGRVVHAGDGRVWSVLDGGRDGNA